MTWCTHLPQSALDLVLASKLAGGSVPCDCAVVGESGSRLLFPTAKNNLGFSHPRYLFDAVSPTFRGTSGVVAVAFDACPVRTGAFVWVVIAPLVSLLFHRLIKPNLDATVVAARSMNIGAVANPSVAAFGGLR